MTVMDAARQALRSGAREVYVVYRGTMAEMLEAQSLQELDHTLEEGVILHTGRIPKRIVGSNGKVTGFETLASHSQYDEKGQPTLVPRAGSESIIECDAVIMAIGQESDLSFLLPKDGIAFSGQGAIVADSNTLATSTRGIFAGGDAVRGPRTIIDAVADGHRAARAIDSYLSERQRETVRRGWLVPAAADSSPKPDILEIPRGNPPRVPVDRRSGVSEVEGVFDEAAAREQAERCLKCHIQTVFNADLCILCRGCVDVCPQNCYKMVRLDKLAGDARLEAMVEATYGMPLGAFRQGGEF